MRTIGFDITVLVEYKKTGIGSYVYYLLDALLRLDQKNKYALLGITPLKAYQYVRNLEFINKPNTDLKSYRLPSKLFHRIFGIWQTLQFPPIEWLTGPVDLFHSFDWFCPPSRKAKIVATIFDLTPLTHPEWHTPGNIKQHTRRLKAIQGRADLIFTISQASKRDIVKILKIDPAKIVIAYPGVDKKKFRPIRNKNSLNRILKRYSLKPGYILFVGTLQPRKNITRLIQAYKILSSKRGFKQNLVLVGRKGKDAEKLKWRKGVVWTDYVPEEDLPFLYNGARVFIYPSLYEGFGMPVLEAMACGCPVVTSNISSLPEAAGNAGILINPYNPEEIAREVGKVLKNTKIHNVLRKRGLERVKRFSWERCARITLRVYETMLKK